MATLAATALTLADHAKRTDRSGKTAFIVEQLSQTNKVLDDMLFKEGNLPTGDQATIRTGLPDVFYRMMNMGTPKSKSTTAQVTENAAMLSARSEVDVKLAKLGGDLGNFRLSESIPFMESMGQQQATTLFYGSSANPEEYVGFANRYNDLSASNGQNIIDGGGTQSDNSSIWLIGWGSNTTYGVYPKGSKAGLEHEDLGIQDAFDSSDNRFRAYMDDYSWDNGLVVKDWRYVVRIANIDISTIVADPDGSTTNLIELMLSAIHAVPAIENARFSFYANRTIGKMLDIQAMNKSNLHLLVGNEEGDRKVRLSGIPIGTVDALTETEARVT